MNNLLEVVLTVLCFSCYWYLVKLITSRRNTIRNRIQQIAHENRERGQNFPEDSSFLAEEEIQVKPSRKELWWKKVFSFERLQKEQKYQDQIGDLLKRAGVRLTVREFIIGSISCVVIPIIIGLGIGTIGSAILFGLAGALLPLLWIRIRIQRRTRAFNEQLYDMLTMMSNSLKSGYSFLQAVQSLATDMPAPMSEEFSRMLREMQMGLPTEEALSNLNLRINSPDFDLVVTAITIQRQIGGNLAEILDNIAETIRERVRIKGEIKALTAQGRFSAFIFMILPFGIGTMIFVMNPAYLGVLFTHPLGWAMLAGALMGQIIGMVIIRQIIAIDV